MSRLRLSLAAFLFLSPAARAIEWENGHPKIEEVDALEAPEAPEAEEATISVLKAAPDLAFKTLDGRTLTLKHFEGRVVVLDFWATWCPACVASLPHIAALREKYYPADVVILGVSLDQDEEALRKFADEHELPFIPVFGEANAEAARFFNVEAIPSTVVLGKNGKTAQTEPGPADEDALSSQIDAFLSVSDRPRGL